MNKIQITIGIIAIVAILYILFFIDYSDTFYKCKFALNDQLIEIKVSDKDINDIKLKSDAGILYSDGEYFYDEPPTFQKNKQRVKIIDIKPVYGWTYKESSLIIAFIIILWFMFIAHSNDEYFY